MLKINVLSAGTRINRNEKDYNRGIALIRTKHAQSFGKSTLIQGLLLLWGKRR